MCERESYANDIYSLLPDLQILDGMSHNLCVENKLALEIQQYQTVPYNMTVRSISCVFYTV